MACAPLNTTNTLLVCTLLFVGAHGLLSSPYPRAAQQPHSSTSASGLRQAVARLPWPAAIPGDQPAAGPHPCCAEPFSHRGAELCGALQPGDTRRWGCQVCGAAALPRHPAPEGQHSVRHQQLPLPGTHTGTQPKRHLVMNLRPATHLGGERHSSLAGVPLDQPQRAVHFTMSPVTGAARYLQL